MTVETRITALWPQTEALLKADTMLEVPYVDARDQAVTDAVVELWRQYAAEDAEVPTDTDDLVGVIQQQVAEMSVLALYLYARDYYLQDVLREGPEGGDVTMYDKLKALDSMAQALRTSVAARETAVAAAIRDLTGATTVRVLPPTTFVLAGGGRGRW